MPANEVLADDLTRLRRRAVGPFVFPGHQGREHVAGMTIHNWVPTVAHRAGVGKVTAHQLRHAAIVVAAMGLIAGCSDGGGPQMPEWVEQVFPSEVRRRRLPTPFEADHTLQRLDEDVRLLIDGTDVTT